MFRKLMLLGRTHNLVGIAKLLTTYYNLTTVQCSSANTAVTNLREYQLYKFCCRIQQSLITRSSSVTVNSDKNCVNCLDCKLSNIILDYHSWFGDIHYRYDIPKLITKVRWSVIFSLLLNWCVSILRKPWNLYQLHSTSIAKWTKYHIYENCKFTYLMKDYVHSLLL